MHTVYVSPFAGLDWLIYWLPTSAYPFPRLMAGPVSGPMAYKSKK